MLDEAHNYIYSCIFEASSHINVLSRYKPIAGWNDHYQDLFGKCVEFLFLASSNIGRIICCDIRNDEKQQKGIQECLEYCKNNEIKIKKEKMLAPFAKNNKIHFWKCCN